MHIHHIAQFLAFIILLNTSPLALAQQKDTVSLSESQKLQIQQEETYREEVRRKLAEQRSQKKEPNTAIIVAVISALVAILSAAIAIRGQLKLAREKAALLRKRDERLKKEQAESIISRYREPLIQAAFELQSRIFNILHQRVLYIYYLKGNKRERVYVEENILYVVGQYFAWSEIIRREIQFLDLGEEDATRKLTQLQDRIRQLFLSDEFGRVFRVFRGEQRAIGELMIVNVEGVHHCIGFAEFVERQNPEFQYWFEELRKDIAAVAKDVHQHSARLLGLQHALVGIIDFLDPNYLRIPEKRRSRLEPKSIKRACLSAGISLGHYKVTAGTLGCVVLDRATGDRLILSSNHVLAYTNEAKAGDSILYPAVLDGGSKEDSSNFILVRFIPIKFGIEEANQVDAAVARPNDDVEMANEILQIGRVKGVTPARLGMAVRKFGKTTKLTKGVVTVLNTTVIVGFGHMGVARYENQIVTTSMAMCGDSGSLLVAADSPLAVGLLFAGSDMATIHNPIQTVLDNLEVDFIGDIKTSQIDSSKKAFDRLCSIQQAHETEIMGKANVVGLGVGLRSIGGTRTKEVSLVVLVNNKVPFRLLAHLDQIPSEIEGVKLDVQKVGRIEGLRDVP